MLATDKLPDRLRVVLLDPDPAALRWLTARLGELAHRRFDVRSCTDADQALQALAERPADLLLLEHDLADGTAGDLLQVLAALRCEVPAIVVARRDGSRAAVTALTAGACDFLPKAGLTAWQLDAALERALQRARQQRRLERHRRALEVQQRELQRRNEELRSSLGVLTEALAEPLAALRTFLGELTLGELDGKQRSALDRAAAGCAGLGSLIDLLGEERAEQAAVDTAEAVTPSDLRGLLERARADAGRIARGVAIVAAANARGQGSACRDDRRAAADAGSGDGPGSAEGLGTAPGAGFAEGMSLATSEPLEVLVRPRDTQRALTAVFEFVCGLAGHGTGDGAADHLESPPIAVRIGDDDDGAFACWDVPMQPAAAAQLAADLLAPSPGAAPDETSRARRAAWLRALPLRSALRTLHRVDGDLHATAGPRGLRLTLRLPSARVAA